MFLSKQNWLVLLFQLFSFYFNPLNPKSDQHQISPCNINAVENRVKSWELITWSGKMSVIDISTNSPNYFYWKSIGTVNENLNYDILKVILKGGISYIPWCIASYYIIKLPNARDPISSTGTRQLNNGGKRFVLLIKPSVPLLCRSIYDFRFTIPNISLVKSKRVFWPPIMS